MELIDRINFLASNFSKSDVELSEPEVVATPSGYVDIVFDEGRLVRIRDSRGLDTEIGHWIEEGNRRVLRLPWPTKLADPTTARPGRSRGRRVTERAAALMQFPKSGTARASVLSAFIADRREGGDGLIDEDVAAKLSMNLYTAAPRRTELVNDGWLQASGKFGRTKMDSESIKWELTPAAVEKLGL
jgi:hypothetical protein